ncbi:imm11 family protein [Corallococcus terminator]
MTYYPWVHDDEDDSLAWVEYTADFLLESPDEHLIHEGVSVNRWVPPDLVFDLSEDYGVKLSDSVPNLLGLLIVSEKLKTLLEKKASAQIEFLSIRLRNPKRRLVPNPYFIANVLGSIECVNLKKTKCTWSAMDPDQMHRIKKLVLDEPRIGPEANLFRLKEELRVFVAREDLGMSIVDAKCTGMIFQDLDDYGSEWRD